VLANAGACPGDVVFLTKPLGTGVLATALKQGVLGEDERRAMVASMTSLNAAGARACRAAEVHALTDVTGYGLLGHGLEMAVASRVALELFVASVPVLPGARAVATSAVPAGLLANRSFVTPRVRASGVDEASWNLLCDPQTSGGLLVAVAPRGATAFAEACAREGSGATAVGRVLAGPPGTAVLNPGTFA
jgi:selenide,water dikinase